MGQDQVGVAGRVQTGHDHTGVDLCRRGMASQMVVSARRIPQREERNGFGEEQNCYGEEENCYGEEINGFGEERNGFGEERNGFGEERNGFGKERNGFGEERPDITSQGIL